VLDNGKEIRMLSDEIMQYLNKHPYAADSLEGVLQWWLCRESNERMQRVIQTALDDLIVKQQIQYSVLPDGTRIYKRRN
jgi:hypothetical protein